MWFYYNSDGIVNIFKSVEQGTTQWESDGNLSVRNICLFQRSCLSKAYYVIFSVDLFN